MEKEIEFTWEDIIKLCNIIAERISKEYGTVDLVVGILRSGAIPAAIVSMLLGVDEVYMIRVIHYEDGMPPREITREPIVRREISMNVRGKSILVVDDLIRTGKTLIKVISELKRLGARRVISSCLVLRESEEKPVLIPDVYAIKTKRCPKFPWHALCNIRKTT